jgi:hypothetical protein
MNLFGSGIHDSEPAERAMPILESLIGPIASIIDKVIPDKAARDKAKLELLDCRARRNCSRFRPSSRP